MISALTRNDSHIRDVNWMGTRWLLTFAIYMVTREIESKGHVSESKRSRSIIEASTPYPDAHRECSSRSSMWVRQA